MTYNEERNIERALRSVQWCEEIIVLDSFSTDRTITLARQYTDRIHQHAWEGFIAQRNRVRELATHEWVLFLDADEELTPASRREIECTLERNQRLYTGYRFPRMARYCGRWIRHGEWYPDRTLRLFLKVHGRSVGVEPHDKVEVDGLVANLRQPLLHYSHFDIKDHIENINNFSSISADAKHAAGLRFRYLDLWLRPPWRFLRSYVLRLGFLDGWAGYLVALMSMFEAAAKYGKLWELERAKRAGPPKLSKPAQPADAE